MAQTIKVRYFAPNAQRLALAYLMATIHVSSYPQADDSLIKMDKRPAELLLPSANAKLRYAELRQPNAMIEIKGQNQ